MSTTIKSAFMQPRLRFLAMTVSVILLSFVTSSVFGQATVSTDKQDYHPGERVLITGSGWESGEDVSLNIVSDCGCTNVTYKAIANGSGNISNNDFLILESHLGTTFTLTASGNSSTQTVVAYFTDANFDVVADITWTQFIAANPGFTSADQITIKRGGKLTIN